MKNLFNRSGNTSRSIDLENTSTVTCPECDEQLADSDEMEDYALDDAESVEIKCPSCGERVEVEARTVTYYVAKVID